MSGNYGQLSGIKFWDTNKKTLLAWGYIDEMQYRNNKDNFTVEEFQLNRGERIVGIKSDLDFECS